MANLVSNQFKPVPYRAYGQPTLECIADGKQFWKSCSSYGSKWRCRGRYTHKCWATFHTDKRGIVLRKTDSDISSHSFSCLIAPMVRITL